MKLKILISIIKLGNAPRPCYHKQEIILQ